MALGFAGLVAATLADRAPKRAVVFTGAFAAVALATVVVWSWGGNLWPYLVMQASFVAAALYATARVPSAYTHARGLYLAAALYGAALACEQFDKTIDAALGGLLSGHTLKHLVAAAALYAVGAMLQLRRPTSAR